MNSGSGDIGFDVRMLRAGAARTHSQGPFRLLVMGDFSGRANRGVCDPLVDRRPLSVDCDNSETSKPMKTFRSV